MAAIKRSDYASNEDVAYALLWRKLRTGTKGSVFLSEIQEVCEVDIAQAMRLSGEAWRRFHANAYAGGAGLPLIACRQTRRGDWIVCEVSRATYGVGIESVGEDAGGFTTGSIYSRHETEDAARQAAAELAAQRGGTVVEWEYPHENRRFVDLPRQYPTQTCGYSSHAAAHDDGWVSINPSKVLEYYRGRDIRCIDVTPGPAFGYDLAIACAGIRYLESQTVWAEDGHVSKFCPMFRAGDLVDAIEAARRWIDGDLMTQAEAARRLGVSTQAIHNATRDGRLQTFDNEDAANPRQGAKLVSWQRCQQVWGER